MKKIDLGQVISILANLGVLAGLTLVAIQISQSTHIAKAQLENDYFLADMQLELSVMGDEAAKSLVKAIYEPDQLTPEDAAILDRYFNFGLIQVRRLEKMLELGLAEQETVDEHIAYLTWHLGNEVGRHWWAKYREGELDNPIIQRIDAKLSDSDFRRNEEFLNAFLEPLVSGP